MAAEYWWRSWHGAPTDNKWLLIANRAKVKTGIVIAIAWAMLDYASQQPARGSVEGFDAEVFSIYSGFDEGEIRAVITALQDKGMIANNRWTSWEKRQPKSEAAIQKVIDWRDKKKNVIESYPELPDVTKKYTDTESETDTKSDIETEQSDGPDPFEIIQHELEHNGIRITNPTDIKALNDLVAMKATIEDVQAGLSWRTENNNGKANIYASSLVGPTQTAINKRLRDGNGWHKLPSEDQIIDEQRNWLKGVNP